MQIGTKLPKVGTTIFTVMSQLAIEHQAVNLGQGFPDFDVPDFLVGALFRTYAGGQLDTVEVDAVFADGVPGTWGELQTVDPLTATQGCAP